MEHQLGIMREILSSFKQEYQALVEDCVFAIEGVREQRLPLFVAFERWQRVFAFAVEELSDDTPVQSDTFAEDLENLQKILLPGDIELHLLQEQLLSMFTEIQAQTTTILHFLEHKSMPLVLQPLVAHKVHQLGIGLADPEHDPPA